jgi:dTDP-4-dehydrorhamnose reductase
MILVTGCNPLGCRLVDALSAELAKGACDRNCPEIPRGWLTYDAMSQESIARLVEEQRPSVIILTEEIDNLSYCQEHRKDAMEFNTRAVRFFTDAAKRWARGSSTARRPTSSTAGSRADCIPRRIM